MQNPKVLDLEKKINMEKKHLKFEEKKSKGKTKAFDVYSIESGDFLGSIHWRNGWRCYVMSYQECIDMSLSCSKELNDFMEFLENGRKNQI
jgi:hypothetical protein